MFIIFRNNSYEYINHFSAKYNFGFVSFKYFENYLKDRYYYNSLIFHENKADICLTSFLKDDINFLYSFFSKIFYDSESFSLANYNELFIKQIQDNNCNDRSILLTTNYFICL